MATKIVDRGIQVAVGRFSNTADAFQPLQSMAVDDSSTALVAGATTLGSPTNVAVVNFDSTPTRSAQTVTHLATFGTGVANFTHRRITLHNAVAGSVTGSSVTLCMGVDGQSITKTTDFAVTYTMRNTGSDIS